MQALAKKHPTDGVEIQFGSKRPRLFLVPKEKAKGLIQILSEYEVEKSGDEFVALEEVFPALANKSKRAAIALRGARLKEDMTQVVLANKLGITQGDLSKMESGERPISKKMAERLAKVLRVDYRIFL